MTRHEPHRLPSPRIYALPRRACSLRSIILAARTHQADCRSSNFREFLDGVKTQRFLFDPNFGRCQEFRHQRMVEEWVGLIRFRFQGANIRRLAILVENCITDGNTFVADVCSLRIVAWARNQFLDDVPRFVAEGAAQDFSMLRVRRLITLFCAPPEHRCTNLSIHRRIANPT